MMGLVSVFLAVTAAIAVGAWWFRWVEGRDLVRLLDDADRLDWPREDWGSEP